MFPLSGGESQRARKRERELAREKDRERERERKRRKVLKQRAKRYGVGHSTPRRLLTARARRVVRTTLGRWFGSGSLTGKRGQVTSEAEPRRRAPKPAELEPSAESRRSNPVPQCMHSGRPACIIGDNGVALLVLGSRLSGTYFFFPFIARLCSSGENVRDGGATAGGALVLAASPAPGLGARGPSVPVTRGHGAPRLVPVRNQLRYLCAGVTPSFSRTG